MVKLIAVVGGSVLIGSPTALLVASGGAAAFGTADKVQSATINGSAFLVAGGTVKKLDCATGSLSTLTATEGTVPTGYRLACNYRGRLVLARSDASPHLWDMSKQGDPNGWEYNEQSPIAAVAGNNARAGLIGDAITALMPAGDDVLYFGGDHSLWRLVGDPASGGTISSVSEQIGVISGSAWCQDPLGWIYFISPQGLYRVSGAGLEQLSDGRIESYFQQINVGTQSLSLVWDRDRKGLWIFRADASGTGSTHLFWSEQYKGFFPMSSGNADIRPLCSLMYDGDSPDDRRLCIGGATDKIYFYDETAVTDAATAIESYVHIGPTLPSGLQGEARAVMLDTTIGEYPTREGLFLTVNWQLAAAEDPYAVLTAPGVTAGGTWIAPDNIGRQANQCLSLRGRTFLMKLSDLSSVSTWVFEKASLKLHYAGVSR